MRASNLDFIDQQVTELLLHAEKRCRRLRTGEVDFSPEVSRAADLWYLWRTALRVAKGKFSLLPGLKRLCRKIGVEMPSLSNIPLLKHNVDRFKSEYLMLKGAHMHHRKQYLLRTQRTSVWHQEQRRKQYARCN